MAEDILDDIVRIRRLVADATKEHGNGKDISAQLGSLADELHYLLEKTEARLETMEKEGLDARTRFVSELSGSFLRTMMEKPGAVITPSEIKQSVDMAADILKHVKGRF